MRYWVTWSWRVNDMIKGIYSDEIQIDEPVTSVEVVVDAIKRHTGEPFASEVEGVLSWSKLEEHIETQNT